MKTVLHVGCGNTDITHLPTGFRDGWRELRLDINPIAKPDVLGSSTDMAAIDAEAVDAVFSSHNVEHVYPHEVPAVFAEFYRVLNADGFAVVTCPNIQQVALHVAQGMLEEPLYESPSGPITALDILYGHVRSIAHGQESMAHRTAFTPRTLQGYAERAGFGSVGVFNRPANFDLWMVASKAACDEQHLRALVADFTPGLPVAAA